MKYFLIAGEPSGDMHGAHLMKAIKLNDAQAEFCFWGGDLMQAEFDKGLKMHYNKTSFMGFVEVLTHLLTIKKHFTQCKQDISAFNPDVVIFIDYPGFNLRMAKYCKLKGYKTVYYIAPKVWAWKESRVKVLEKYIDELLLIFPFETNYFKKWQVNAKYIGNPMAESIFTYKAKPQFLLDLNITKPVIALLPGSRKQEIAKTLPIMSELVKQFSAYEFVIAGAPGMNPDFYANYNVHGLNIIFNKTYDLLSIAKAAVVCSGTATLETALFNVPQVCGYKANAISMRIAKWFVKIKYISLVNLCLDKPAIVELIQDDFTSKNIANELVKLVQPSQALTQLIHDYQELKQQFKVKNAATEAALTIKNLAERQ